MNYTFLISAVALTYFSYLTFQRNEVISVVCLFFSSFFFGLFISTIDPFLNTWDEQFHALVAKNISNNGITPMLYNEHTLPFNYKMWVDNEVWLHKQPLFIWQMALSIKLFGVNELSVRLPSVLMHSFTSVFVFYIGRSLMNKPVGIISAILFSVSFYQLELVTGKYSTDHNDVAFLFYCTGSFWSWFNYVRTGKNYWLFFIAVFSGCAVLVKWLLGLLVYIVWLIIILISERNNIFHNLLKMSISSGICLLVFMPWQIYILYKFPKEALYEYNYNSLHLYEAIEGHSGSWFFHFDQAINEIYGDGIIVPFVLLIGAIIVVIKGKIITMKLFFIITLVFTYLFFTLVQTKMLSYTLICSPFLFVSIGSVIYFISSYFHRFKFIFLLFVMSISGVGIFNLKKINYKHSIINNTGKIKEKKCIESLDFYLKKEKYLVFNFNYTPYGNISAMFYSEYECYRFIPTKEQVLKLRSNNEKIACIDTGNLPEYIINDFNIVKIKK